MLRGLKGSRKALRSYYDLPPLLDAGRKVLKMAKQEKDQGEDKAQSGVEQCPAREGLGNISEAETIRGKSVVL